MAVSKVALPEFIVQLGAAEDCRLPTSPLEATRLRRRVRGGVIGRKTAMTNDKLTTLLAPTDTGSVKPVDSVL